MQAAEPNTVTGATAMEVVCDIICCAPAAQEILMKDFRTLKELEDCVNSITGPVSVKVQGLRSMYDFKLGVASSVVRFLEEHWKLAA